MFKVIEVFSSIQGEGKCTGSKATFIRFAGCNLNCWFCNEKEKNKDHEIIAPLSVVSFAEHIKSFGNKYIIFTGGEPMLQLQSKEGHELLTALKGPLKNGHYISVETNGIIQWNYKSNRIGKLIDLFSFSPKTRSILERICFEDCRQLRTDFEIKILYPRDTFKEKTGEILKKAYDFGIPILNRVYIQPMVHKDHPNALDESLALIDDINSIFNIPGACKLSAQLQKIHNWR